MIFAPDPIRPSQTWLKDNESEFYSKAYDMYHDLFGSDIEYIISEWVEDLPISQRYPGAADQLRKLTDYDLRVIDNTVDPSIQQILIENGKHYFTDSEIWEKDIVTKSDREVHNETVQTIIQDLAYSMFEQIVEYAHKQYK